MVVISARATQAMQERAKQRRLRKKIEDDRESPPGLARRQAAEANGPGVEFL